MMRPLELKQFVDSLQLEEGQKIRTVCPDCEGGSTTEKSFNIWKENGEVHGYCHRASCPYQFHQHAAFTTGELKKKLDKPSKFVYNDTFEVPKHFSIISRNKDAISWVTKSGLDEAVEKKRIELRYDPQRNNLVTLVKDFSDGKVIGAVGKPLDWYKNPDNVPKWWNYDKNGRGVYVPHYGWGSDKTTPELGIVEDIVSASAVAGIFDAYALRGTTFTDKMLLDVAYISPEQALIMLDPGAQWKSLEIEGRLSGFIKSHVLQLVDDPKNIPTEELKEFLRLWKENL